MMQGLRMRTAASSLNSRQMSHLYDTCVFSGTKRPSKALINLTSHPATLLKLVLMFQRDVVSKETREP